MKPAEPRVVLTVRSGQSPLGKREFVCGTPVAPFSVGARGDWSIRAEAVDQTHLFLAFDGHRLHAAAASHAHALSVDGRTIGCDWTLVAVPSLLAFGAASIAVDREDPGPEVATAIRPRPVIDLSRTDQQPTQILDLSRTLQLHTVRLEISDKMLAELREAPAPEPAARVVTPLADPVSARSGDTLIFQPAPVRTQPLARPPHSLQKPFASELVNTLYDGGALRERAAQLASSQEREPATPGIDQVPPPTGTRELLRHPLTAFRRSSLPKQLAIALLPLLIAGVWAIQGRSASASSSRPGSSVRALARPSPKVVISAPEVPSASAAPSAMEAPSARPVPSPPGVIEQTASATGSPPNDSSERMALVAAFSGNKAEAAARYERLAATRNSRVFSLAARLTRDDRVRKP